MAVPRNGYNTPGMNTYATPQGTLASGLGDSGPGGDALIARYRQQQAMNSMTPSQRAYVQRFGTQSAPAATAQSGPPPMATGTLREEERMYLPRNQSNGSISQSRFIEGVPTTYGSTVIKDPRTGRIALFGGNSADAIAGGESAPGHIDAVRAAANRAEMQRFMQMARNGGGAARRYADKQRQIFARRAAMQPGRPLQSRFGGDVGAQKAPAAGYQQQQPASAGNRVIQDYQPRDANGQAIDPFGANGMTRTDPLTGAQVPQTPGNSRPLPDGGYNQGPSQESTLLPNWMMGGLRDAANWWYGTPNRRQ